MWLIIRSGEDAGKVVEVTGEQFLIGRDPICGLTLNDPKVSRSHAYIKPLDNGTAILDDLQSTNGTFVNGARIQGPVVLQGNERLQLGDVIMLTSLTEPVPDRTVIAGNPGPSTEVGGPPAPPTPRPPGPATLERRILRRSVRRATIIGLVGLVSAATVLTLLFTGVLTQNGNEPSVADVVGTATPSTALITTSVDGQPISGGTGWVLDAREGLIVTNHHVVNGGTEFTVALAGSQQPAEIAATAPCEDLALLRIAPRELTAVQLGSQSDLKQGDTVVALGFPASGSLGDNLVTTTGVVSVVKTAFDLRSLDVPQYPNVIQTDAAINPGNSGGPLLDLNGKLVGVNSAGITLLGGQTIQGQGYAIGVDRVKDVTQTLRQGRSIGWTGLNVEHPLDGSELTALGLPPRRGLLVTGAVPGTPADEAGFGEQPALLLAINGVDVDESLPSYCDAVRGIESGETAVFTVAVPGRATPVNVELRFL